MPQRYRQNFIGGLIEDNPLTSGATTLNSAALAAVDVVTLGDTYIPIILDPDGIGGTPEIAYITAHAASATTATISRAEESTTSREHKQDIRWVHGPTVHDFMPFAAKAHRTTAQSIPNNTETAVIFNSEIRDDGGLYDAGGVEDRFTIPPGGEGWYVFNGWMSWDVSGAGERQAVIRTYNSGGANKTAGGAIQGEPHNPGSIWIHQAVTHADYMVTGDYVQLRVFQASGGALNSRAGANFSAIRMSS